MINLQSCITTNARKCMDKCTKHIEKLVTPIINNLFLINRFQKSMIPSQLAAETYSPAIIAQFVYDLAKEYNRFYTEISIFNEDDAVLMQFRIALSALTAETIKVGMRLLGIEVPNRM